MFTNIRTFCGVFNYKLEMNTYCFVTTLFVYENANMVVINKKILYKQQSLAVLSSRPNLSNAWQLNAKIQVIHLDRSLSFNYTRNSFSKNEFLIQTSRLQLILNPRTTNSRNSIACIQHFRVQPVKCFRYCIWYCISCFE